ncbi:MAG: hypothetical protein NTY32_14280 [Bacteroidia bacterium]|nr:hypothetical protein [Bacteroidia bacterium]
MKSKYRIQKTYLIPLFLLIILLFGACTMVDELTVIHPKTLEEYKVQMIDFLAKEKLVVDSAKVGYNKGNFRTVTDSTNVKSNYLNAIIAAQVVVNNEDVTIAQIALADKSLAIPGKAFWLTLWISDRRALNDSIVAATTLNTLTLAGDSAGRVLNDTKTAFSTAISKATSTRGSSTSVDLQLKTAIATLTEAKKTFIAAIIPASLNVFVANSKTYITTQKLLVESSVVGYGKGEYPVLTRTNYLNALTLANDSANKVGVSYKGLSGVLNALIAPRTAYIPFVADHRSLNDTIIIAEGIYAAAVVGTAKGQVVTIAKTTLNTAITTAKTARETTTLTEGLSNAARYKIGLAVKTFNAGIVLGDLIIDSETLKAATVVGTSSGQVSQIANSVFALATLQRTIK